MMLLRSLQRWQRHCQDLHRQRLKEIKAQVDVSPPGTMNIQLSKGKRAMLEKERQYEIDKVMIGALAPVPRPRRRRSPDTSMQIRWLPQSVTP